MTTQALTPAPVGKTIPIPPALRDLLPKLAQRAATMLATGELVQNADGTYTRHTLPFIEDQAA